MKMWLSRKMTMDILALALAPCALAEGGHAAAPNNLGTLMCVGDSLSHGTGSESYRWFLHKIFVDNGITYKATGYHSGGFSGGKWQAFVFDTTYGTKTASLYTNTHSAQFNAKLSDFINGNPANFNIPALGCVSALSGTGTFTMMLGTNDLNQGTYSRQAAVANAQKLVATMLAASPGATVYVMAAPVFANATSFGKIKSRNINGEVQEYRDALAAMAGHYDKTPLGGQSVRGTVKYVDVNKGITDVSASTPNTPWAVRSMTAGDGLHLTGQADLIIAGNLAHAMGYAGATAGLKRKSPSGAGTSTFSLAAATHSATTTETTYAWPKPPAGKGFTAVFRMRVGNGAESGWSAETLSVTVGDANLCGTLRVSESRICWGDTPLYSGDMSSIAAADTALRIAYTAGNTQQGVEQGFYVWLGDMLIGQALQATAGSTCNGLSISASSDGYASISDIYLDSTGAYAPAAQGTTHTQKAFLLAPAGDTPASRQRKKSTPGKRR